MGVKSTQTVSREKAIKHIESVVRVVCNKTLALILEAINDDHIVDSFNRGFNNYNVVDNEEH